MKRDALAVVAAELIRLASGQRTVGFVRSIAAVVETVAHPRRIYAIHLVRTMELPLAAIRHRVGFSRRTVLSKNNEQHLYNQSIDKCPKALKINHRMNSQIARYCL